MRTTGRPLQSISDDELLNRLKDVLRRSRLAESDLVAHLAEVDDRRLYAREACPAMFAYCTQVLGLSEPEAYLRITAARASIRHPVLLEMLADGRMHLSGIALLARHLTAGNRDVVLARAASRSKREVEELVAELAPRPDARAWIRALPARAITTGVGPTAGALSGDPGRFVPGTGARIEPTASDGPAGRGAPPEKSRHSGGAAIRSELRPDQVDGGALTFVTDPSTEGGERPTATVAVSATAASRVEPVAPGRYKVQFTASAALKEKLERLQALMRATVVDGGLAAVIEAAVTEKIERLETRRFGRTRRRPLPARGEQPREAPAQSTSRPRSPHVPAAVRRAVRERDGDRCCYRDRQGRRCAARDGLEFHHRHPYGFGGRHSVENVCLMCPAHNRYIAVADYGQTAVAVGSGHSGAAPGGRGRAAGATMSSA